MPVRLVPLVVAVGVIVLLGAVLLLRSGGSNHRPTDRVGLARPSSAPAATATAPSETKATSAATTTNVSRSGQQIYDQLVRTRSNTWVTALNKMPLSEVQKLSDFVGSTAPDYEQIYGPNDPTVQKMINLEAAIYAVLVAKTPSP
jgi:hypothetical protein